MKNIITHYTLEAGVGISGLFLLFIRGVLTPSHGLAIKLGIIPCFIPTLFAVYLNKIALSAILKADVYASAVSRTPGPVSVSEYTDQRMVMT